jgi:uncharacterized protein (TIGR03067 family)
MFCSLAPAVCLVLPIVQVESQPFLDKIQGEWREETHETEGVNVIVPRFRSPRPTATYVVDSNQLTMYCDGRRVLSGTMTIDPRGSPKTIDIKVNGGHIIRGIIMVDGEYITACVQMDHEKPRPTQFNSNGPEGATMLILHRVSATRSKDK